MIRTVNNPLRVSILGGGTDMPEFVEGCQEVGHCLVYSLDLHLHAVRADTYNTEADLIIDDRIDTPLTDAVIDTVFDVTKRPKDIATRLWMAEDIPTQGTGLGSSAAWVRALSRALGRRLDPRQCYNIERSVGSSCGYQDHVAAMLDHTTLNSIVFRPDKKNGWDWDITQFDMSAAMWLHEHLRLFRVPGRRDSNTILAKQAAAVYENKDELIKMREISYHGLEAIHNLSIEHLGSLVKDSWEIKKHYAPGVSTPKIDEAISLAYENMAHGAKILGAGGCGYLLTLNDTNNHDDEFDAAMKNIGLSRVYV